MTWIKMRTSLSTDPAVVRIATGQNLDRWSVIGRLHTIWSWAGEHSLDGNSIPIDDAFIDELAGSIGFADAMRRVGWLEGESGNLCFPRFSRHNGDSAKARALDAERKRKSRDKPDKCPENVRVTTGQNSDQRRGEESREEESRNNSLSHTAEIAKNSHIENPQFQAVWDQWGRHLLELGKSLTATTSESQLYRLADFPVDEAIAIVEFSISRGARNLITTGDHRGPPTGGGSAKRQRRVPSFEEGLLRD